MNTKDTKREESIIKSIFTLPIFSIVFIAIFLIIVLYISLQNIEKFFLESSKKSLYSNSKNFAKNIVLSVEKDMEFNLQNSEERVKELLKIKIDEAEDIINKHPNLSKKELKTILSCIRYNHNRGYYFAYEYTTGIVQIHPIKKIVGKSVKNFKDEKGRIIYNVNKEVLKKGGGSGYIQRYFYKPNETSKKYKKILYLRYIKKLNWVIGTGEYVEDMKKEIKKSLIKNIMHKRYGKNGYLWIHNSHYVLIAHPYLKEDIGKSEENLTSATGEKVVKMLVDGALAHPEGTYVTYHWRKIDIKEQAKKIAFVKYMKDFDWILGTGIYVDDIDKYVRNKKDEIEKKINNIYNSIFIIVFVGLILTIILSLLFSKKIQKLFSIYSYDLENRIETAVEENKKKDALLQQQSKLAAMGEMIGAIAHQWRQPLNALSINIQNLIFLKEDGKLESKEFLEEYIKKNKNIIDFMSKTIDDFRNFFRTNKESSVFSAKNVIDETVGLLSAQLKNHNIEIIKNDEEFDIKGSKSEFQQVVLNIISNAKDALIEKSIKEPKIWININKQKREILFRDNAGGVDESIIDRIFEPYFTTKEQGKGTGLGLYMSKMIMEENFKGSILVENWNSGAVFRVRF